jgi:hypothetical protein
MKQITQKRTMMKKGRWVWTPQVSHAVTANYCTTKGKDLVWIETSKDFNALQCLQQLYDADLVNELLWEYQTPSNTQYASEYPDFYEEVKVSIFILDDNPLSLSQDRSPKLYSRKVVKYTLASITMDELFKHKGEWYKNTAKEMKSLLFLCSPESEYNS